MMNQNTDQNTSTSPQMPPQAVETTPTWKVILEKLKPVLSTIFNKFYSNKKVFWPVSVALGLIFLILIVGTLFGRKASNKITTNLPTSTPFILSTPVASASGDIISTSEEKLNDLKNQIDNLDVKQSRLQPPSQNFEIRF